jgi:hypothetical protein
MAGRRNPNRTDGRKEMNEAKTYQYNVVCHNCNRQITLSIPKGTTVGKHLDSARRKKEPPIVCGYCGVVRDR